MSADWVRTDETKETSMKLLIGSSLFTVTTVAVVAYDWLVVLEGVY